jgi:uncharacterized protein
MLIKHQGKTIISQFVEVCVLLEDRILTFNKYMNQRFGSRVSRISFDTGISCPWNKCVFCRHESFVPENSIIIFNDGWEKQFEKTKDFLHRRYNTNLFAAYFQNGTSTFGPKETLKKMFSTALSLDGIVSLIVSTRPDYLGKEEIEMIIDAADGKCGEIWIELGLQSIHDDSLNWLNRGHDKYSYFKALDRVEKYGKGIIKVAPHIILGIPGETTEQMVETIVKSTEHNVVKGLKLHHLQIHSETELEKIYNEKKFELLDEEKYLSIVGKIIGQVPKDVVIIRLFTTSPGSYLVAPKWGRSLQYMLEKLDEWLIKNNIEQGKGRI